MNTETFAYADDLISKAMMFAIAAHSGQFRKGKKTPAIVHAMEAAVVAATLTDDIDVMAAALLHDTVEDTDVTADQIRTMFGDKVADLVANETENKRSDRPAEDTWMIRKQESIEELKASNDINVKILWLSDKLSNMRSFYRLFREEGEAMWNRFNQKDPKMQKWYYTEVTSAIQELKDTAAYEEFTELTERIFGGSGKD